MTSAKVVDVTPKIIDDISQAWFIDKRVELISDGIVKHGVACILGSLLANPESPARLIEFTQTQGIYKVKYVVLYQVSRHTKKSLADGLARSLRRILERDVPKIIYSDVDDKGYITFTYTPE